MSGDKQQIRDMRYGRQGGRIVDFGPRMTDPNVPRGWTVGPCWKAYCSAKVVWPPNTVGADIECDSMYPHRGHVHPTRYPKTHT